MGQEGLVAPLIVRFACRTPIYPIALTSLAGQETEILLYTATQNKMTCGGRLRLRYAGEWRGLGKWIQSEVEPEGFFEDEDLLLPYFCRFRDTLTPAQMREDISFTPASNSKPYREHVWRW